MSKPIPKRSLVMPSEAENRKLMRAARADPDALPLLPSQLKAMVPIKSVLGRPKLESKKLLVSVRYSPEVLSYFRGTGEGWQTRMDAVLQEHVAKQGARRARRTA